MKRDAPEEEEEDDDEEGPSKSEIKREFHRYQALARTLVQMPERTLADIPLDETLREQVMLARRLSKGALQRQLRYLGKRISEAGASDIEAAIDATRHAQDVNTRAFHELEQWRDGLAAGNAELMTALLTRFPHADGQHLRQLARNARREREAGRAPRAARALFRYLAELRDG